MVGYWNLPEATAKTLGGPRAHRGLQEAEDPSISSTLCRATPPAGSLRRHLRDPYWVGKDRQAN